MTKDEKAAIIKIAARLTRLDMFGPLNKKMESQDRISSKQLDEYMQRQYQKFREMAVELRKLTG